jgi:hypothetical protein
VLATLRRGRGSAALDRSPLTIPPMISPPAMPLTTPIAIQRSPPGSPSRPARPPPSGQHRRDPQAAQDAGTHAGVLIATTSSSTASPTAPARSRPGRARRRSSAAPPADQRDARASAGVVDARAVRRPVPASDGPAVAPRGPTSVPSVELERGPARGRCHRHLGPEVGAGIVLRSLGADRARLVARQAEGVLPRRAVPGDVRAVALQRSTRRG